MDIAGDPSFAKALTDKVADHLIEIGKESLRRGDLYDTGLWIYDDMGNNLQPMMSPAAFEKIFLPAYKRMVKSLKEAGPFDIYLTRRDDHFLSLKERVKIATRKPLQCYKPAPNL